MLSIPSASAQTILGASNPTRQRIGEVMTFSYIIVQIDLFRVMFGFKYKSWNVMGKEVRGVGLSYW